MALRSIELAVHIVVGQLNEQFLLELYLVDQVDDCLVAVEQDVELAAHECDSCLAASARSRKISLHLLVVLADRGSHQATVFDHHVQRHLLLFAAEDVLYHLVLGVLDPLRLELLCVFTAFLVLEEGLT